MTGSICRTNHPIATDADVGACTIGRFGNHFRNLLDNALKYSGAQPQVEVETHSTDGHVAARIGDNGPGIPANLRRKIFGRFVRLGSELERKTAGTGLGLYIVRNLVRRSGGTIQVRSREPGPGTVFEVKLPMAKSGSGFRCLSAWVR